MRFFKVTLEGPSGRRELVVPSPTEVQAGDAAAVGARPDELLISIEEVDGDHQQADVAPPTTQTAHVDQTETPRPR